MTKNIDIDIENRLLGEFKSLGISKQASLTYLSLFAVGETGIARLERETGLHRQIVYNALSVLEGLGLVKHAMYNGRKRFSVHPPRRILSLIDEKRRTAETLIEELNGMDKRPSQEFEVYQGDKAFVEHQFQTLYDAEEGETLDLIGTQWEKFYGVMGRKKMEEYEKLRKGRNISIRYLGTRDQFDVLKNSVWERPLFSYRIIPGLAGGLMNTSIWNKSVIFNFFGSPVIAFVLRDESVAKSQRDFFEALWKMGSK